MTIQELIDQQMHHFIGKLIANKQLSHEKVIEVSSHIGAYLIRNRYIQHKKIADEEINLVLQNIAGFLSTNFENQFNAADFIAIKETTLNLLKNPRFDEAIKDYFKLFYQ
jgi:hypothetical protein